VSGRRAWIAVALGVTAAATIGFAHSASTGAGAQVARGGACTTSQLKIRMLRSFVAAGNVGGYIGFRNREAAPCRLTGWPTLVAFRPGTRTAVHVRSTMFGPHVAGIPWSRFDPAGSREQRLPRATTPARAS
jgi:hypothetical protein